MGHDEFGTGDRKDPLTWWETFIWWNLIIGLGELFILAAPFRAFIEKIFNT